ncbi:hypothetical protein GCM10027169_07920 [Gordonia jinhuaensis]|uniref:O-antigen ligase n=1 Tax=Gordonia jinhuaensis TaxID=1517702 RepID=A0A916WQ15_9ACTN|nr:hypothetical protein [Gordonia jinhuaensis]GGB21821.1 hypothetical protein GCM10011489_07520 [Gordonia jinhuaensis]
MSRAISSRNAGRARPAAQHSTAGSADSAPTAVRSTVSERTGKVAVAVLVVLAAAACALMHFGTFGLLLGVMATLGIAAVAVAILSPRWIYALLGFLMACLANASIPGAGMSFGFVLTLLAWVAVLTHPVTHKRIHSMEIAVLALVIASFVATLVSAQNKHDVKLFLTWTVATSLVFLLLRLSSRDLLLFGRAFTLGTVAAALFGLFMLAFDKQGTLLNHLWFLGYGTGPDSGGTNLRYYLGADGTQAVRLSGTYIDPNAGGIFLFIGLGLSLALYRGTTRVVFSVVIAVAMLATLSRSAIAATVVAAIILVLFHRMRTASRTNLVIGMVVCAAAALSVPTVAERLLSSFGSSDKGSADRGSALAEYPSQMAGHWWFGRPWASPEFVDAKVNYQTNFVANSPLLSTYRGGVFVGLAFTAVLIVGILVAARRVRHRRFEVALLGAGFISFAITALQLDYPVVTLTPVTAVFSMFIAFMVAAPRVVTQAEPSPEPATESSPGAHRAPESGPRTVDPTPRPHAEPPVV